MRASMVLQTGEDPPHFTWYTCNYCMIDFNPDDGAVAEDLPRYSTWDEAEKDGWHYTNNLNYSENGEWVMVCKQCWKGGDDD